MSTQTYRYYQTVEAECPDTFPMTEITNNFASEAAFISASINALLPSIVSAFAQGYQEKGVQIWNVGYINPPPFVWLDETAKANGIAKLRVKIFIVFDTDSNLQGSPIAPLVIIAIGIAIAIIAASIIVAYTVPPLIEKAWEGMTTTTVTSEKYEWVQNPNTGVWEWKLVSKETVKNPNPAGILASSGMLIVGIVAILFVAMFMWQRGKKE